MSAGPSTTGEAEDTSDDADTSVLFTYVVPFVGVLLVAVGIGAAVPGGYAVAEDYLGNCGDPTIAVESPEATAERFADGGVDVTRLSLAELSDAERAAFREARTAPRSEAHVEGPFPHYRQFLNGTVVTADGEDHYVTVVAENACFDAAPLQFPLGVFAIGLGVVGILTPPVYRKLAALEREAD